MLSLVLLGLPGCRTSPTALRRPARTPRAPQEAARVRRAPPPDVTEVRLTESQLTERVVERAQWLEAGIEAFEKGRLTKAAEQADRVLAVEPDNAKAAELKRASTAAADSQGSAPGSLTYERERFRAWIDDFWATADPKDRLMKWPSRSFWEALTTARAQR